MIRVAAFLIMITLLGLLTKIVVGEFIVSTLSDDRAQVDIAILDPAAEYFPNSAKLLAQLARSEMNGATPDLERAEQHALSAINRSPNNYNYRLLLGEIRGALGNQVGAEDALKEALKISPNNHVVHWRIANLLIRERRTDEALEHFHFVINFNPAVLPFTLDLIWSASGQNIAALTQIVRSNPKAQLKLALFLANKLRIKEAVNIFTKVDRDTTLSSSDTPLFLDALISKGFPKFARELWLQIRNHEEKRNGQSWVWNGDFEIAPIPGLKHFEWHIRKSEYAKISIDGKNGHSGTHSLLIDFLGRDTTRLDNEFSQLIVLRPGLAYRLEFFVKTVEFDSPNEGPSVVVAVAGDSGNQLAKSKPISPGNTDWRQMSVTFTTPRKPLDGVPLLISIKRQPRYAYDSPTRGRIWFDDFAVSEASSK